MKKSRKRISFAGPEPMPSLPLAWFTTLSFFLPLRYTLHSDSTGPLRLFLSCFTKLASLPFRFKGSSGAMGPIPQAAQHHHRATTKTSHKAFKTKHASKNSLRDKSKGTGIPTS